MGYNQGNLKKYMTRNPLKWVMVDRFNRRLVTIVRDYVEKTEGKIRILDAGCGERFIDRRLLNSMPKVDIVGLDSSAEAVEIAKDMNPEAEYILGDICDMPFDDNSFEYVICTEVLEHLLEPEKAFRELERVAKDSFVITVPHEPWFCMGNLLAMKNVKRLGNPIDHMNHWTKRSFQKFLLDNHGENHINGWTVNGCFPWIIARYFDTKRGGV